MAIRDFSDREMALIQRTIDLVRSQLVTPVRAGDGRDPIGAARNIHIAKTPSGGIPALTQNTATGTGTGTDDLDSPGEAECDIYRVSVNESFAKTLEGIHQFTETVLNLSTSAITDEYILVIQTAFGDWVASTGSGSPCGAQNCIMDFTIIGSPNSGTFDCELTVNGSKEVLTFNYDDNTAEVTTELLTHTEIVSGDVEVTEGPFPAATMRIQFKGNLANTDILLPTFDWSGLDNNVGTSTASATDATGLAVIASKAQLGVSG